jgi:hypothetical protein
VFGSERTGSVANVQVDTGLGGEEDLIIITMEREGVRDCLC